jgi:SAM-dependent methyltransferase
MTPSTDKKAAMHFDDVSDIYESIRPGYTEAVFNRIDEYCKFNEQTRILEIGAGNGVASASMIRWWNPQLVLVEPGVHLAKLLTEKFSSNKKVNTVNQFFEDFSFTENRFDALIAATAFHWLNPDSKFQQAHKLLNKNGVLILFWNNYLPDDEVLNEHIQKVYDRYSDKKLTESIYTVQKLKIASRRIEIADSGLFNLNVSEIFIDKVVYTTDQYIQLLKTYSDHASYPEMFYHEIATAINTGGGEIMLRITANLEIAEKK